MIHVENISRKYGDFTAVDNVSFKIPAGEIVGLLGHNGAGKTTIMKMLTGFIEANSGNIIINGLDITEDANAVKALIGYLPENLPVYPELSIVDYLAYCADMRNIPETERDAAIARAIAQTQLQEKAIQPISTLSRGFKQRVGVAQALLHKPKILILDEPTNGLDPQQTQQMRQLILDLAKEATVILSTHIMQEVDAVCDRVLILHGGKLAVNESMDELRSSSQIQLDSDASDSQVKAVLPERAKLMASENCESGMRHVIDCAELNIAELIADISSKLITKGTRIFAIHPLQRDLETVFRNISLEADKNREMNDAA